MSPQTLSVHGLRRDNGPHAVLAGVDLEIAAGERVAVIGANGAGKSTLLRTILDLRAAHGGSIRLAGRGHTDRRARATVAYLPERFQPPAYLDGAGFLRYMLALYGTGASDSDAAQVAAELGLGKGVLASPIATCSRGTARLLGLAACLASGRPFLVLDEPTAGLERAARLRLRQALDARRADGISVLFSSRPLTAAAAGLADRLAILHGGRILADASIDELCRRFGADDLESAYLRCTGAPGTMA